MITFNELLSGHSISDVDMITQHNLEALLKKINIIRTAYNKPMTVTSGLRTKNDQVRIYSSKGITDLSKIPMGSAHISGNAVDVLDYDGSIYKWCLANPAIIEQADLYIEKNTKGWVHFQSTPFKSYKPNGTRFFNP